MTARIRFVGKPTPNEHPRQPIASLLAMQLAAMVAAGQNAIVELRGFGLDGLADALHAEVEKVRTIQVAAAVRTQAVVRIEVAE